MLSLAPGLSVTINSLGIRFAAFAVLAAGTAHLEQQYYGRRAHRVTPDEDSEPLPVLLEVHCGAETQQFDLKLSRGQVVLPLTGGACWVKITRAEPAPTLMPTPPSDTDR